MEADTVVASFSPLAPGWISRYHTKVSFRKRLEVVGSALAEFLKGDKATVLDFGGGPGLFSALVSDRSQRVLCLDPSWEMIQAGLSQTDTIEELIRRDGSSYRPARIDRVVGTIDCLRTEGNYDLILAIAVIEYLERPHQVLAELLGRLRPEGVLLVTLPDSRTLFRRLEAVGAGAAGWIGDRLGIRTLSDRSYTSNWPAGAGFDWVELVYGAKATILLEEGIPLGDGFVKRRLRPTRLFALTVAS